jgi:rhodanese-related sulfurtransferase
VTTVETISRDDLKAKIDQEDDFVLVETLSEEQYQHAHLPGAVNIPPYRERELAGELIPDKDADVVVYCGSPQ